MRPDLHKMWIITATEFSSSLRTKAFLVGLLFLPLLVGARLVVASGEAERVEVVETYLKQARENLAMVEKRRTQDATALAVAEAQFGVAEAEVWRPSAQVWSGHRRSAPPQC